MENENKSKVRKVYNSTKLHAKRDLRRREAKARQATYDKLTLKQRLDLAKSRRGKSEREVARLTKKLKQAVEAKKSEKK